VTLGVDITFCGFDTAPSVVSGIYGLGYQFVTTGGNAYYDVSRIHMVENGIFWLKLTLFLCSVLLSPLSFE
jgi:hypothetical protein